jgi:C-terminal processing protease CtpA/Prc
MKTILPWALVVLLSVLLGQAYLAKQKLEAGRLAATAAPLAESDATIETNLASVEPESDELKNLRKDHEDLLRLRNEVRQLRENNKQLETQVKTAATENSRREAADAALRDAQAKVIAHANEQATETPKTFAAPGGTVGLMLAANGTNPSQLFVNRVATNSPAGRAGIPAGARLLSIDGVSMDGISIAQSVQLIRGNEGTQVTIEYEDPQSPGVRKQATLVREKVTWEMAN